jgi:hypothetical protein
MIRVPPPTLGEIVADEALLESLDAPTAAGLSAQASALAGRLAMRAMLARPLEPVPPDQALSVTQAAVLLGKAPTTLYRLARQEPYQSLLVPTGNRTLRFSSRRISEYLGGTATSGPTEGIPALLGRRKGIPRPARPSILNRGGQRGA